MMPTTAARSEFAFASRPALGVARLRATVTPRRAVVNAARNNGSNDTAAKPTLELGAFGEDTARLQQKLADEMLLDVSDGGVSGCVDRARCSLCSGRKMMKESFVRFET